MPSTKFFPYRRSNGYWYIGYLDEGCKRWKSPGQKLKNEALKVLTEFEQHLKKRLPTVLFSEFVRQFQTLQGNTLRQSTVQRICLPAFKSFAATCGDKSLTAYSLKDVETFKRIRLETCSPTTVNIEFRTLRAAFNFAIKWQLLNENPFGKSSPLRVPNQLPSFLSRQDFQGLLGVVEEPVLKDVFLFAVLTGTRQGEILNLQWADIDFEQKIITISSTQRFATKTGNCRKVPMSETVLELLSRRQLTASFSPFVFHRKDLQLLPSYVQHKLKGYARKLGLSEKVRFDSLRHTFATWLVQEGVSIYEVQKLLGHSDISVTQVYSHLAASELHDAVNRISVSLILTDGRGKRVRPALSWRFVV
jgi:site-specific recombinase XerD